MTLERIEELARECNYPTVTHDNKTGDMIITVPADDAFTLGAEMMLRAHDDEREELLDAIATQCVPFRTAYGHVELDFFDAKKTQ